MSSKRSRVARRAQLSADVMAWLESDDAVQFFTAPEHYQETGNELSRTLGWKVWWLPPSRIWAACRACEPIAHVSYEPAVLFLLNLHEQHLRMRKRKR